MESLEIKPTPLLHKHLCCGILLEEQCALIHIFTGGLLVGCFLTLDASLFVESIVRLSPEAEGTVHKCAKNVFHGALLRFFHTSKTGRSGVESRLCRSLYQNRGTVAMLTTSVLWRRFWCFINTLIKKTYKQSRNSRNVRPRYLKILSTRDFGWAHDHTICSSISPPIEVIHNISPRCPIERSDRGHASKSLSQKQKSASL